MLRALMWLLSLGLLAWALWLWPEVPDRIPLHFGADGTPDRWGERSLLSWLTLPLVGLGTTVLLDGVTVWAVRHPESPAANLPDKQVLMDLSPERRVPVLRVVAQLTYALGVLCIAAFTLIQLGTWTAANGRDGSGWVLAGGLGVTAGSFVPLVWGLMRASAEIKRQQRAMTGGGAHPGTEAEGAGA